MENLNNTENKYEDISTEESDELAELDKIAAEDTSTDELAAIDGAEEAPNGKSNTAPNHITVVGVRFKNTGKVYYFDPGEMTLANGENVVVYR